MFFKVVFFCEDELVEPLRGFREYRLSFTMGFTHGYGH